MPKTNIQEQSPLFKVPGEIRNNIYYYALDMPKTREFNWRNISSRIQTCANTLDLPATAKPLVPDINSQDRQRTTNLLFTCKQVHREARSLLEETTYATVPLRALQRLHPTSKLALGSFLQVIIAYPKENERKKRKGTNSKRVTVAQYGWELVKALGIFIKASSSLCSNRE
jgi:hypothetical protein